MVMHLLEIAEELEVPVEKENTTSRKKLLKRARQNPLKTVWVIRHWLREDNRSREKCDKLSTLNRSGASYLVPNMQ